MANEAHINLNDEAPHIDFLALGTYEGRKITIHDKPKYFGWDYATFVQRMAWVVLSYEEVPLGAKLPERAEDYKTDTPFNRRVLWLAAYFHAIGRTKTWDEHQYDDAKQSAKVMRAGVFEAYPELKAEPGLLEAVCDTIANYKEPNDVLSRVLHDSVLLAAPRVEVGTRQGLAFMLKAQGKAGLKMVTVFGKHPANLKKAQQQFGWAL